MIIRKLLAGASVLALSATPALALDLTLGDTNDETALGAIVTNVALAEEATAEGANLDGNYELTVSSTGTFADAQNYLLTVEVFNGEFTTNLTGEEVTDGRDDDGTTPEDDGVTISGSSVQAEDGALTGREGESTVTFLVSTAPTGGGDNFGLELPVAYTGDCDGDLTFRITLSTSEGIPFEEGVASLDDPAVTCVNAYQASVLDDRLYEGDDDDFDSVLTSASDFTAFDTEVDAPDTNAEADGAEEESGLDVADEASLAKILIEFNPERFEGPILDGLSETGEVLNGDEVEGIAFDVTFPEPEGIENAVTDATDVDVELDDDGVASYNYNIETSEENPYMDNLAVVIDGETQIIPQQPVVTDVVLSFDDENLIDSEDGIGGNTDDLNYEGVLCGNFDWVGDATKPVRNVFRATGFGDQVSLVQAVMTNSSAGLPDATADLAIAVLDGTEIIFNQAALTAAHGNYGRADFTFNFVGATQSLDCDRLMSSPTNAVVSDFGNDGVGSLTEEEGRQDGDDKYPDDVLGRDVIFLGSPL